MKDWTYRLFDVHTGQYELLYKNFDVNVVVGDSATAENLCSILNKHEVYDVDLLGTFAS